MGGLLQELDGAAEELDDIGAEPGDDAGGGDDAGVQPNGGEVRNHGKPRSRQRGEDGAGRGRVQGARRPFLLDLRSSGCSPDP